MCDMILACGTIRGRQPLGTQPPSNSSLMGAGLDGHVYRKLFHLMGKTHHSTSLFILTASLSTRTCSAKINEKAQPCSLSKRI